MVPVPDTPPFLCGVNGGQSPADDQAVAVACEDELVIRLRDKAWETPEYSLPKLGDGKPMPL
jgi:hypothetical protein